MSVISVRAFGGMKPSLSADLLAPGEAQLAQNVRLTSGELRPLKDLQNNITLSSASTIRSIYRFGQSLNSITQFWFQSDSDVDWVKGPVANDTQERTYFTDGAFPKKTDAAIATSAPPYPSASYAMGIPPPATAPTVSVSGSATDPTSPGETVVFVYTYTTAWGEEGPPSPASTPVTWRAGQTINITGLATAPGAGPQGQNYFVNGKRLYRSATGSQATQYQLVTTGSPIALATTSYNDTATTASLGEALETTGWLEPAYNMIGLCAGPNGMMAGFFGNTVAFCVPGVPYAWPVRYQQSTDAPIVGIAWYDQTLVVGTTQGVYLYTGADPANMVGQKLGVAQSFVSKRSVVPMLGGVIFASPDGLFRIDAGGITNLTDDIMTREDWQAYAPSSISAYESDNRYVAFYDNGTTQGSLIFELGSKSSFSRSTVYATAGFRDKKADALFVVTTADELKRYDAGSSLTWTWTSGVFHLDSEVNMAAARVDSTAYPLTFQLYADGVLKHTQNVANAYAFRLPSGYRSLRYHFTISGTGIVRAVEFATTMAELTAR